MKLKLKLFKILSASSDVIHKLTHRPSAKHLIPPLTCSAHGALFTATILISPSHKFSFVMQSLSTFAVFILFLHRSSRVRLGVDKLLSINASTRWEGKLNERKLHRMCGRNLTRFFISKLARKFIASYYREIFHFRVDQVFEVIEMRDGIIFEEIIGAFPLRFSGVLRRKRHVTF